MPFARPTLTELRQQTAADITSNINGADGLLRRSNLSVIGTILAGMANLHYGYLDWISKQSVPFTCDGEFLEGWAALVGIFRQAATVATGNVKFPGNNGTILPAGTLVVRGDQESYLTTAQGIVDGTGFVTVPVKATTTGSAGNTDDLTAMTLGVAISGIQSGGAASGALTGGTDTETDDSFRTRMLVQYAAPPQGGAAADYINWALAVPGVTRAWCLPNGQGTGTVVVYFMMDIAEAAHSGFPQGSNGVATGESRDAHATGDQLAVANYIYPLQPVTALVYAVAPAATPQNFTIKNINPNTAAMKTAVQAAITDLFTREGSPGGTIAMADVTAAIDAVPGVIDFIITSPLTDIVTSTGCLPTLGIVTWI